MKKETAKNLKIFGYINAGTFTNSSVESFIEGRIGYGIFATIIAIGSGLFAMYCDKKIEELIRLDERNKTLSRHL